MRAKNPIPVRRVSPACRRCGRTFEAVAATAALAKEAASAALEAHRSGHNQRSGPEPGFILPSTSTASAAPA